MTHTNYTEARANRNRRTFGNVIRSIFGATIEALNAVESTAASVNNVASAAEVQTNAWKKSVELETDMRHKQRTLELEKERERLTEELGINFDD